MNENIFDKLDFGPLRALLDNDDITDISFDNNGQIWVRSLTQGSLRVEVEGVTPEFIEKLAFQCSNVMGTTFNNAKPFLDAESAELRLNFVHQSIATNGIAMVIRKTPAKIRLEKEKLLKEDYFTEDIHNFLIKCVEGHCNIIVCGETGSGKTEFVKYLASHTKTNEKVITIEDTLELHLDKIFPQRDIVAMKTNNVASYTDVLVTCMRQNPKWILLSEVRSAEAVSAVRNSISSGHNILSTIHADKASAIPYRLYSLMETDLDVNQFLTTIYRYIQLGVHIKAYYSKEKGRFQRELDEVVEFYVDDNNVPQSHTIYRKQFGKQPIMAKPSAHLIEYLDNQNIDISSITAHMNIDEIPDSIENIVNNNDSTNSDGSVEKSNESSEKVEGEPSEVKEVSLVDTNNNIGNDKPFNNPLDIDNNPVSVAIMNENTDQTLNTINETNESGLNNEFKLDTKEATDNLNNSNSESEISNTNISVDSQPLISQVTDNSSFELDNNVNVTGEVNPTNNITIDNTNPSLNQVDSKPNNQELTIENNTSAVNTNLNNNMLNENNAINTLNNSDMNSNVVAYPNSLESTQVSDQNSIQNTVVSANTVGDNVVNSDNGNVIPAAIDIPIIQNINTTNPTSVDINSLSTLDGQVAN